MKTAEFNELQRFKPVWIWFIIILVMGIWIWGVIQQLILKIPFGNNPAPDLVLLLIGIIPVGFSYLLIFSKLHVVVKNDGIYFRYFPFHLKLKKIGREEIRNYTITKYSPIKEYGGWGIRYALGKKKGRAYNVRGNIGMQLELKNGKNILLGTEKPEAFQRALDKIKSRNAQQEI